MATVVVLEASSRSSSMRFATISLVTTATPVALPPGRLMLATSLARTGSTPLMKRIGIVAVAAFAARAD